MPRTSRLSREDREKRDADLAEKAEQLLRRAREKAQGVELKRNRDLRKDAFAVGFLGLNAYARLGAMLAAASADDRQKARWEREGREFEARSRTGALEVSVVVSDAAE